MDSMSVATRERQFSKYIYRFLNHLYLLKDLTFAVCVKTIQFFLTSLCTRFEFTEKIGS